MNWSFWRNFALAFVLILCVFALVAAALTALWVADHFRDGRP